MREVLIILTKQTPIPELLELEREIPDQHVEVLDFTQAVPNYDQALDKIFQADSVQVW